MPSQAATQAYPAPGIVVAASWRVQALTVLPGLRLSVTFRDGTSGTVDCSSVRPDQACGVYAELADPEFFARVYLDLGVITWPNGADLDPVWMYEQVRENKTWSENHLAGLPPPRRRWG